jgi:hypothetical protein
MNDQENPQLQTQTATFEMLLAHSVEKRSFPDGYIKISKEVLRGIYDTGVRENFDFSFNGRQRTLTDVLKDLRTKYDKNLIKFPPLSPRT